MVQGRFCVVLASVLLLSCGGGGGGGGSSGSGSTSASSGGSAVSGATNSTASFLGSSTLLIGAQMADATAAAAPFDARYRYLAGGIAPQAECVSSCNASSSCGGWWGCWQDPNQPPGQYVLYHMAQTAAATWQGASRPQLPVITYYEILPASGGSEGAAEVAAINDAAKLARYLDDWRFLLRTIGSNRIMLHIEPDFWGYVRSVNGNPHSVPAAVTSANPTDCADQENSAAGFARCLIAMARKYAPNAAVGLHASPWTYTVSGDGVATGNFMLALGADQGDFVVTDPADRDAGYYEVVLGQNYHWWDDAKAAAYLAWSKDIADTVGKPTVMWQIPLGNVSQNNTDYHYKDNRVDYLFAHLTDVSNSRIVALLFGSGETVQTNPETDGGNLMAKTIANWQAGGTPLRH